MLGRSPRGASVGAGEAAAMAKVPAAAMVATRIVKLVRLGLAGIRCLPDDPDVFARERA